MRMVAQRHSVAKPTAKRTASAAKPTAKPIPPWRKRTAKLIPPWRKHAAKLTATLTASAAKPSAHDTIRHAKRDAIYSYECHQTHLHKTMEEMQVVWFAVFDSHDAPATLRISWRSCWGRLESILKAIFLDVLQSRIIALSGESWARLANVLEALKAKLTYHHNQSVLQNQSRQLLECFANLIQKSSDVSVWHTILDELLCNSDSSDKYRTAQADLIEEHLNHCNQSLRQIATLAQQIAVPT